MIVLKIYAMADIRPWRKLKLQFVSAEKWIAVGEEVVDGALAQVGGHGAWDKDQTMQVSDYASTSGVYIFIYIQGVPVRMKKVVTVIDKKNKVELLLLGHQII